MAGSFLASSRLHLSSSSSKPFAVSVVASRRLFTACHSVFARSISHRRTTSRVSRPVYPAAGIQFRPLTSSRISRSPKMVAEDFEAVLKSKYPGKAHAKRVVELIRQKEVDATGVLYLESRMTKLIEDNDSPEPFRQRRFFYYLTGCNLADSYFTYDLQTFESTLFIPPIEEDDVIWSGLPLSTDEAKELYDVDHVKFTTDINQELTRLAEQTPKSTVYALAGQVSSRVTFLGFDKTDFELLKPAIELARVVKDEFEVAMIRKANHVSAIAHHTLMSKVKGASNERELYATFQERCTFYGAQEMAYHPIMASGRAAATLHYVKNDEPMDGKLNILVDAGAEWNNYASDITRTFPINGKFTKESREIYDIVLEMQKKCIAMLKADIQWEDVHVAAHKIAIDGLLKIGVLKGDADEILEARTSAAFFPHGLGHYLGMDTHDTGGNPNNKDQDILFRYLRVRGTLPAGSVVTVEPGVYFCKFIIDPYVKDAKHRKFIDPDVLDKYWDVGGVRIEDNVLVTENGYENLTDVEKEPERLEALILKQ